MNTRERLLDRIDDSPHGVRENTQQNVSEGLIRKAFLTTFPKPLVRVFLSFGVRRKSVGACIIHGLL